jgi:hypothetical protein
MRFLSDSPLSGSAIYRHTYRHREKPFSMRFSEWCDDDDARDGELQGESCGGFKPITRFSECKISLGFALFAEVASRLAHNFAGVFERRTIIIRELRQHPGEKKHRKRRGLAAVAADQERTRGVLH